MKTLVFATNNENKAAEINALLGNDFKIITLREAGIDEDIPETQPTLEGNAVQKAQYVFDRWGMDCFADDTGLEITALNGAPGVLSARYAGPQRKAEDNMSLVLKNLEGQQNRKAQFRTVIALFVDGKQLLFEGVCPGAITLTHCGSEGFGYDPIFKPAGMHKTFAEMDMATKNAISHRGLAVRKMINYLRQQ